MSSNSQSLAIILMVAFLTGFFVAKNAYKMDTEKAVSSIVSCEGYDENFLKSLGYKDRKDCQSLNLALANQYGEECLGNLKNTGNEKQDKKNLNLCIYYSFEKNSLYLNSEYSAYRSNN